MCHYFPHSLDARGRHYDLPIEEILPIRLRHQEGHATQLLPVVRRY
jgi:DNA-directed RNA polymerase